MKTIIKISTISLLLISIIRCSSGNHSYAWLEKEALKSFGENHSTLFNSDSSFVVITNEQENNNSNPGISRFMIFNVKNRNKIYEANANNANIKWVKNHLLQVTTFPGIESAKPEENSNGSYYFNVLTLKKTKL